MNKLCQLLLPATILSVSLSAYAATYLVDDFENNELQPVHTIAPEWVFSGSGDNAVITGEKITETENSFTKVKIEGSGSWARFGRLLNFEDTETITFKIKANRPLVLSCNFWEGFANIDIGGYPNGRVYANNSFMIGLNWTTININIADLSQTSGARLNPTQADLNAFIFVITSIWSAEIYIDDITIITSEDNAVSRYKTELQKEILYRNRDLETLESRGYEVSSLGSNLINIETQIASINSSAEGETIRNNLKATADNIDALRKTYRLSKRLDAIKQWLPLLNNNNYQSSCDSLESQLISIKNDTSIPGYSQLDADISALWNDVWNSIKSRGVSYVCENGYITREDGLKITFYGTNDFQAIYPRSSRNDYERMTELGLNTVRLPIVHSKFEEAQEQYNIALLNSIKQDIIWAAEYGINCVIDLHFPHPDWLMQGPAGYESPTGKTARQNIYAFLDTLKNTHQFLAQELSCYPNVIGFEVLSNEPSLKGSLPTYQAQSLADRTIATLPWLMENWNQYLHSKYQTRENLQLSWSPDYTDDPCENGLEADENWDNNSILPPGASGETKEYSTRLYDFLCWAAHLHAYTCSEISKAIKQISPDSLTFQQQMVAGSDYSGDPIPIAFETLHQYYYDNIDVLAAHYNLGCSYLTLPATKLPWYNGELPQTAGWLENWRQMRNRNGGIIFWAYSSIPDSAEDLRCFLPNGRLKDGNSDLGIYNENRTFIPLVDDEFYGVNESIEDNFEDYYSPGASRPNGGDSHLNPELWTCTGSDNWSSVTNNDSQNNFLQIVVGDQTYKSSEILSKDNNLGFNNSLGRTYYADVLSYHKESIDQARNFFGVMGKGSTWYSCDYAFVVIFTRGYLGIWKRDNPDYSGWNGTETLYSTNYSGTIESIKINLNSTNYNVEIGGSLGKWNTTGSLSGEHGFTASQLANFTNSKIYIASHQGSSKVSPNLTSQWDNISSKPTHTEKKIGIIYNSRLAAVETPIYKTIENIIKETGLDYHLLGSMFVVQRPEILANYDALLCYSDYLDPDLISIFSNANRPVLISGNFEKDINARDISYKLSTKLENSFSITANTINQATDIISVRKTSFCPYAISDTDIELVTNFINENYIGLTIHGDINYDGNVNLGDIAELGKSWQENYFMETFNNIAFNWLSSE